MYILMYIPAAYFIERYGAKMAMIVSLGASVIGTWIGLYGSVIGLQIVG